MNYLVAIVLLITIPGTFATIRRGQADADTSVLHEKAQRQLKGAGGGGGMGVVMGMKAVATPAPTIAPTPIPTPRPTPRPTITPSSSPSQQPSIDLTEFNLGTVSFSTSGSTFDPEDFFVILQTSFSEVLNANFPFRNDVDILFRAVIQPTPTVADTTSQVTVYSFNSFVPTSDLLMNVDGLDFNAYVRKITREIINLLFSTFNNKDFQNVLFETLSLIQESDTFLNSISVFPSGLPPQ